MVLAFSGDYYYYCLYQFLLFTLCVGYYV